ncbi:MAG: oxidoreductase [Verrucomicrobiaceae bacterium]|nr:oxidoreductase [Verrucomicrobiaceae bacterium]
MPKLIKDRAVIDDDWQLLREIPAEEGLPAGKIIVPLDYWLEQRDALLARGDVGVWLSSDQAPTPLAPDLETLPVIAIDFPLFTDGRGFSYGRTLREHHGYKGEVRAIGQFIRDQLFYLSRCGFDAFAIETADPERALASFDDFSDAYSAGIDQPVPWFRRHNQ